MKVLALTLILASSAFAQRDVRTQIKNIANRIKQNVEVTNLSEDSLVQIRRQMRAINRQLTGQSPNPNPNPVPRPGAYVVAEGAAELYLMPQAFVEITQGIRTRYRPDHALNLVLRGFQTPESGFHHSCNGEFFLCC